jgi:hypothetical protein
MIDTESDRVERIGGVRTEVVGGREWMGGA